MKRYRVTMEFDSKLEDNEIESAMSNFLDDIEYEDYEEDTYSELEILEEYPNYEDIEADYD